MTKRKKNKELNRRDANPYELAATTADLFRSFPEKRYTIRTLTNAAGGGASNRADMHEIVTGLTAQGLVEEVGDGKYQLHSSQRGGKSAAHTGIVDMHSSGSAHVTVEGLEGDVFIPSHLTSHALHKDKVEILLRKQKRSGELEGEILRVIERSNRTYVGRIEISRGFAFVKPDSRKIGQDIYISPPLPEDVKENMKVSVKITDWPKNAKNPHGEIVEVLGMAGENDTEMHAILAEYDLPYKFTKEVEDAAEAIPTDITPSEIASRRDMRSVTTFTIDPADAKDFDDALSIKAIGDGFWEIGVHIADVTHYVRPGSIVDTEGESRATSVYLVDRTVPMLPERLSNALCSLRPDEDKLTFSAIFEMDSNAQIRKQWFGRTVIRSDRRFAYEDAQKVIETGEGDLRDDILTLNGLAQKMRAARFSSGSIAFERDEAKFILDENGKPLGVYFKEQKEANQLIEEFMLLANKHVAEYIGRPSGKGEQSKRTFVYRVHDKPDPDRLAKFTSFIMRFGYQFQTENVKKVAPQMNALMEKIRGKAEENVISTLAIRAMSKAYYSTDNIGHYGLAFPYYTHFTSPIRRYPDMMVHRLLANYLEGGKSPDKAYYENLCDHSSEMEVKAAEAERSSVKYKMVEFMVDRIGQEFDGTISGVTEWGVYVELSQTHIEGMVSLREMADDFYVYDEGEYAIIGRNTGRKFTLGDKVRILVLRADLFRKQLDFRMAASYDFNTGKARPVVEAANPAPAPAWSKSRAGSGRGRKKR